MLPGDPLAEGEPFGLLSLGAQKLMELPSLARGLISYIDRTSFIEMTTK